MPTYHYAASNSYGTRFTYDSDGWMVHAFRDRKSRDAFVKEDSAHRETVDAKTAYKIAPDLRNEYPQNAHRVVVMD